ncbi:MAG: hypothetical protein DRG78_02855 [Epsilonproteobacteria bacterium]|nr:MAG: hypothetical protein DRG78_02855 [Campylobacterota bacterium]
MKIILSREEQEVAIKGHLVAQGMDLDGQTVKCIFGRESVTVELTAVQPTNTDDAVETVKDIEFGNDGLAPDVEPSSN